MHYLLFTTTTCVKCPVMKQEVAKYPQTQGKIMNEQDPDFLTQAKELGVSSVPALITFDEDEREIARTSEPSEVAKLFGI